MSYVAEFSPEAIEDLSAAGLSIELLAQFEKQIILLEAHPAELSRPSWFPYPQCQLHEFSLGMHDTSERFRVLFKYGSDERTLFILRVDVTITPRP